jgi:hypothetical protein
MRVRVHAAKCAPGSRLFGLLSLARVQCPSSSPGVSTRQASVMQRKETRIASLICTEMSDAYASLIETTKK